MPLPQPFPEIGALDLLVSVAERGSINEAAAAHEVSQPAASMRLRSLEQALGLQLLERSPAGSRLTPAGEAAVGWATSVLDAMRALLSGAAALKADERSRLRIAASLTVAEYLIPGWLRALAAADASLQVSLTMGNTAQVDAMVSDGAAEVGFTEGDEPPTALRWRDVRDDELLVVVTPAHPWARRRRPVQAAHVAATPLLVREPGSGTRDVLLRALSEHGLEVVPHMELGSTTAIKAAAVAGDAPAVLSALAVEQELRSGQLVAVACEGLRLDRTIRAVWRSGHRLSAPAAKLVAVATAADHQRR